ncbi:sigma 54-interacting transcriptional regulator [Mucilaginibacter aquaedulcis]|uniref:sigma 54-interacting transcriptional regulator n=1 Tax=Mucilaginibacter aquaedulcis TaxID=1187081 RepID=UPI0025B2D79C|nr:sigma 54-interacting transcriptional regulator [Mucilaginibacter aquaedulcis]MDN3551531.1 sigma 54-interacting transcriptional regulator [Mucilaginibacter aquaedulcis]
MKEEILPNKIEEDILSEDKLLKQITAYEQERDIIFALSTDITKVREKDDLIRLFSSRLKNMFHFLHSTIMLVDKPTKTFIPFLVDPESPLYTNHRKFPEGIKTICSIDAPIIKDVFHSKGPMTFLLDEIIKTPNLLPFVNIIYECGIKEIMITPLRNQTETLGFISLYSNTTGSFTNEFKQILNGIAPQLSSAVSNIIVNEGNRKKDYENEVLLALSREIANVKTRKHLLHVINKGLSKLIRFTNSVMTVLSNDKLGYKTFLTESVNQLQNYSNDTGSHLLTYPADDGICDQTFAADRPLVFDIRSFDLSKAPQWLKLNYAAGARELLIKALPYNGIPKHSIILFADKLNSFNGTSIEIIESVAGQLTKAANNITANEAILNKERDKSHLLTFSKDLAAVKTKEDLETAIFQVLDNLVGVKLSMIRVIEDGGLLIPYLYDKNAAYANDSLYKELLGKNVTVDEPLSARVLSKNDPVIFNIEQEEKNGNNSPYIAFWKKTGYKNMFGVRLCVGNENIGTLWLLINDINYELLRGLCSQISVAIFNIKANEKLLAYKQQLEVENDHLKEQIKTIYNFSEIIGRGPQMEKVYRLMSRVAESGSTVLILGETGTGKELIARGIHNASQRKDKLMIKVNCAALPPNLIESELFGHEKGSFTGAFEQRIGKFELAHNSTLFLDEIGELPIELQVKLLRVIQEREFERVGGKTTIKVNVRIIAATNRNLEAEILAGKFRSDLYYRLNVFPITLPPLRDRAEDIALLVDFFLTKYSKITGYKVTSVAPKALQQLKAYLWPGNVRELEHVIERSILMANDHILHEVHLPKSGQVNNQSTLLFNQTIEEMERSHIIGILKQCQGKISGNGGAAEVLEVQPTTLHSKMRKLNITKPEYLPQLS